MSALTRKPLMLSTRIEPTGDSAYAEGPKEARLAARTLMRDARDHGAGDPRASFYCQDELVRADVQPSGL